MQFRRSEQILPTGKDGVLGSVLGPFLGTCYGVAVEGVLHSTIFNPDAVSLSFSDSTLSDSHRMRETPGKV